MKKILILLCTIMFIIPVNAQKNDPKQEMVEYDLLERSYQQRIDVLKSNDELLNALLKIPFEKRVYVYPALFESHHIPKKIVTHPQILQWKGKKPTRIAPQLQEFAKKHLEFMSAKYYPFLDPDGWPKVDNEDDWHNVVNMLPDTLVDPATAPDITKGIE